MGKKRLAHFVWLMRKNVDSSYVVRSLVGSPNNDQWGQGRIMINAKLAIFYFSGKHEDRWDKLHQVCQLFFSIIVASLKLPKSLYITLTLSRGWWGRLKKTISRRGKEGRVEKKSGAAHPQGPGLEPGTYRMRRGSPVACHGGCLDKQTFPCL